MRCVAAFVLALLILPAGLADATGPPTRYLVSFDTDAPAVGAVLGGARVLESFPFANVALLEGPATARDALARLPDVAGVYDEEPVTLAMDRERGIVGAQPPAGADWPTGEGVTVALVDSGIDASHPAFSGRVAASVRISRGGVVSGESGDDDGHGTHVAGIVGGDGAKSADGRHHGIAPGAGLVGVDISDSFTTTNAVRAFAWIHENAPRYQIRVVSNSWGREKDDAHYDPDDPVIRASDALVDDGIVVVFSAGNRGRDGDATLTTEATNPRVITVGAASATGRVESYSSRGPALDGEGREVRWTKPDLMAPGSAVVSTRASALANPDARTDEERYYTVMNGTSMAAPQAAAAAALLLDTQPDLQPSEVMSILQRTAADLGAAGADAATGYGMLDVGAALAEAASQRDGVRRVVTETRVPVRMQGSAAAAVGQVLLADNAPRLPPSNAVSLPLPLPTGAASVELWFNWTGEGSFSAQLVGPEGALSFEDSGARSLRLVAPATPGSHRIEALPQGVASYASYAVTGSIVVREETLVEAPAEPHGQRATRANAFVAEPSAGLVALDALASAPLMVMGVAATLAVAGGLAWRARK